MENALVIIHYAPFKFKRSRKQSSCEEKKGERGEHDKLFLKLSVHSINLYS